MRNKNVNHHASLVVSIGSQNSHRQSLILQNLVNIRKHHSISPQATSRGPQMWYSLSVPVLDMVITMMCR
jgi:hypothetical protein